MPVSRPTPIPSPVVSVSPMSRPTPIPSPVVVSMSPISPGSPSSPPLTGSPQMSPPLLSPKELSFLSGPTDYSDMPPLVAPELEPYSPSVNLPRAKKRNKFTVLLFINLFIGIYQLYILLSYSYQLLLFLSINVNCMLNCTIFVYFQN